MSPEEQARLLARWLEGEPGAEPPSELDEEVAEAVWALRPERAPAPRVSADDILASLTEGPLAEDEPTEAAAQEVPAGGGDAIEPANRPRWLPWLLGGGATTALAMAAAALLVVNGAVKEAPDASSAPARESAGPVAKTPDARPDSTLDAADAPADEAEDAVAFMDTGAEEDERSTAARQQPAKPSPAGPIAAGEPLADELGDLSGTSGFGAGGLTASGSGAGGGFGQVEGDPAEDALGPGSAAAAPPPAVASRTSEAKKKQEKALASEVVEEEPAVADLDDGELSEAEEYGYEADDRESRRPGRAAPTTDDAPVQLESLSRSRREDRPRGFRIGAQKSAPAEEPAPAAQPDPAPAAQPEPASAAQPEPAPADLAALRRQALPADYAPAELASADPVARDWMAANAARAEELKKAGRTAEAAAALTGNVAPPVPLGQRFAIEAADLYLVAGDPRAAAAVAQQGLALSTGNTAARSRLLVAYADALAGQGDRAGAEAAYRQAIALNAER